MDLLANLCHPQKDGFIPEVLNKSFVVEKCDDQGSTNYALALVSYRKCLFVERLTIVATLVRYFPIENWFIRMR